MPARTHAACWWGHCRSTCMHGAQHGSAAAIMRSAATGSAAFSPQVSNRAGERAARPIDRCQKMWGFGCEDDFQSILPVGRTEGCMEDGRRRRKTVFVKLSTTCITNHDTREGQWEMLWSGKWCCALRQVWETVLHHPVKSTTTTIMRDFLSMKQLTFLHFSFFLLS